jgi:ADP-ribose pyrophosphatase YjhB (NUDIX family)
MLNVRINDTKYNQDVTTKTAARALIIKDNKVAILYSKKYNAYITPGGGVEENESLEEACMRETKEEAGLIIEPLEKIVILDCNYPNKRIIHHYFLCKLLGYTNSINRTEHEKDQDLEMKWLTLEQLKKAYSTQTESVKYASWMQNEYVAIAELRKYL